jgi:hypothetical protein
MNARACAEAAVSKNRPACPGSAHGPAREGRLAVLLLLLPTLVVIGFNAVKLWPEVSLPVPNLNDDAVHYLVTQRASEALAKGENPFDHWLAEHEMGFPVFRYYQHLPHLTVVLLHRLLLGRVDLLTVFNLVRYAILLGFPLVVYWSMRRMDFSAVAAAVSAAACSLISVSVGYGFGYESYDWRGHGMYTQLWAMPLSFVALACLYRLVNHGTGYAAAVLACSALALSHLIYTYMMVISGLVVLLVGLDRTNVRQRIGRLAVVGVLTGINSAYVSVPFLLGKAYLSASVYLQRWKYDSYGAADVLKRLVNGDLLDAERLPILTVLLALGVATALFSRARPARLALALFVVWLLLYFGRPTWGRLLGVLPLHEGLLLHRFVGSVDLAAILLIGLGGEWLWRRLTAIPEPWRAGTLAVMVLVLLESALGERSQHYSFNTQWMERAQRAIDGNPDVKTIIETLRTLPPGRTYVGLREDWGKQMRFGGDLRLRDLLIFNRIVTASAPYGGLSLNADLIWHFDDRNPAHYDLLNVRYLVAPWSWKAPAFLRPIKETGRYVLYEAPTSGYAEFAAIARRSSPASQAALFTESRSWFQGPDPAAGRFIRYDYPHGAGSASADAGQLSAGPRCPDGKVRDERVGEGRIELRAECPVASTLVLKVTYHPNWRVTVDGRDAPTFMVSPSFIGVGLPPGGHDVRAEYRSGLLKNFLVILAGLTVVAVILFRRRLARIETLWAGRMTLRRGQAT